MAMIEPLMRQNFLEYASYVIVDRAIPDLRDGCKPVQRRILHTLYTMDDGRFMKVANVIGECMKLHPHGDASIGDALIVLANKGAIPGSDANGYFIERQGNFGNIITGHGAAAPRYIECRLTALSKETTFNPALTTYVPAYDGRKDEPEFLPSKLPTILLLGTEGIAVGMATSILPHNFGELLQAQVKILRGERFRVLPDFPQGGLMDASEYADGRGRVKLRAKIDKKDDKTLVIREIPFGTTTDSVIASIETAVEKGKVKIGEINDRTTAEVEVELHLQRGVYADEVLPQLFAYTECEVAVTSNIVVIRDRKPAEMTVRELLEHLTEQLKERIKAELEHELKNLVDKQHQLTLEQIFIENRVYKRIESAKTEEAVSKAVYSGMEPFSKDFVRDMTDEDVARLLEIRIKRISQYDIDKNRRDIDDIVKAIKETKAKLKDLVGTTITWLHSIIDKYAKNWPRRTKVKAMEEIDKKAVANANLRIAYDPETGFLGTAVRGGERELKVSEYDKVIVITEDGMYKIMSPPEKTLIEGKIRHLGTFDEEKGLTLTMVYRDKEKIPWAKLTTIKSYIRDREYELIKDRAGKLLYLSEQSGGVATIEYIPMKGARVHEATFDLATLEPSSPSARGTKAGDKPASKASVNRPKDAGG
jgi:topoisomerase-4 subunit A